MDLCGQYGFMWYCTVHTVHTSNPCRTALCSKNLCRDLNGLWAGPGLCYSTCLHTENRAEREHTESHALLWSEFVHVCVSMKDKKSSEKSRFKASLFFCQPERRHKTSSFTLHPPTPLLDLSLGKKGNLVLVLPPVLRQKVTQSSWAKTEALFFSALQHGVYPHTHTSFYGHESGCGSPEPDWQIVTFDFFMILSVDMKETALPSAQYHPLMRLPLVIFWAWTFQACRWCFEHGVKWKV